MRSERPVPADSANLELSARCRAVINQISPGGWEQGRKKYAAKRKAPLWSTQRCQPARTSRREATPLAQAPPLTPSWPRPSPVGFLGPAHQAWPCPGRARIPPTITPPLLPLRNLSLLFKEYVYVSPLYVACRHQCKARRRNFLSLVLTASGRSRKRPDPGQNQG